MKKSPDFCSFSANIEIHHGTGICFILTSRRDGISAVHRTDRAATSYGEDSPFTSGRAWQRQPGIHVRELIKPMHPRHFADSLTKLLAARIRLEAPLLSTYDPCAELGPGLRCKRTFPSTALLSYRFITQIRLSSHRVHSSPLRSTLPTL